MQPNDDGARQAIRLKVDVLAKYNAVELARVGELGRDLSFGDFIPYFERILALSNQIGKVVDTQEYSSETLQRINSSLELAIQTIKDFTAFSVSSGPPNRNLAADRTQLIINGTNNYNTMFRDLAPIIAYGVTSQDGVAKLSADAQEILAQIREKASAIDSIKDEADRALSAVRAIAQRTGVSQHAGVFSEEARSHESAAWKWLIATLALTLVTAGAGLYFFIHAVDPSKVYTGSQAVQVAVAKLALLSISFTATIWVGRLYRAHRHNAVVNKHRSNALRTFETFAESTNDESTKNAVLIKATECIFSPQQTGYNSNESDTGGAAQVVEIVRGITSKSS